MSNDLVHASLPAAFPTRLEIDTKDVWNAFFLHSLLLDHDEQRTTMVIEHNASSQADRLKPQLQSRNARMSGPGQEQWNHACDMCCWVYEEDGKHCKSIYCRHCKLLRLIKPKIKFDPQLQMASPLVAPAAPFTTVLDHFPTSINSSAPSTHILLRSVLLPHVKIQLSPNTAPAPTQTTVSSKSSTTCKTRLCFS